MKSIYAILAMAFLYSSTVFGHGSDKPGPNGGYIQMPGPFHTEVVPEQNGNLRIYLSDIEFKNPTVTNSEVKVWLSNGKKKIDFQCKAESDYFLCSSNAKVANVGQLKVMAKRQNIQGSEAKYQLPFKPWKKAHSSSHH